MLRLNCKITFTPGNQANVPKEIPYSEVVNPPAGTIPERVAPREIYVFDFVHNIEVEISRKDLCSTARIILPRNVSYLVDGKLMPLKTGGDLVFRKGDRVKIETGYLGDVSYLGVDVPDMKDLRVIFSGFINDVGVNTPIEIFCEDDMYMLNKTQVIYPLVKDINFYGRKKKPEIATNKIIPHVISLKKFIQVEVLGFGKGKGRETAYCKDAGLNEQNIKYGDTGGFRCDIEMDLSIKRFDCSSREVFNKLKREFPGLFVYFKYVERTNGTDTQIIPILTVSWLSDATESQLREFWMERNIIDARSLKYRREEDIELQCRATGYDVRTGDKLEVTYPDDKDINTTYAHIDVFTSKVDLSTPQSKLKATETLKLLAQKSVQSRKYEGYMGSFETFGEPFVRPGDIAQILSSQYKERNAKYLIQSVKYSFGMDGYRQYVELGDRVSYTSGKYRSFDAKTDLTGSEDVKTN